MIRHTMISVRLTEAMLAEIDATAAELGLSRSDLVKARLRWAVAAERVAYDNPGIAIASQEPLPLPMAAE